MRGAKPRQAANDNSAIRKAPAAPGWLSPDAKKEWKRIVPRLTERRVLTGADLGGLENLCVAMGRIRQIERLIQASADPEEIAKLSRVQDKAMATARQLSALYGLTPVDRSRPAPMDDDDADSLVD